MTKESTVRVLVIDDEESIRRALRLCLDSAGYHVTVASSGEAGVTAAKRSPPDVALVDLRLGGMNGIEVTRALRDTVPSTIVVLMTAYATIDNAVEAIRSGATDYLPKPFTPQQVLHTVSRALDGARVRSELAELQRTGSRGIHARFQTNSAAMRATLEVAERVAETDATLLILGETGTGKGVLSRHIHARSPRAERPFVTVNCAVIAPNLIESELFGHTRGAFTGADTVRAGHIEAAASGTLFLDEIGDLPRDVQGKLLRLLEEHEYVRVGDVDPRRSNARIVAATHHDLKQSVTEGRFREDLYYRLDVVTVRMPPLRERKEDLPALAEGIMEDLCVQHRRKGLALPTETMSALLAHDWPGNLRELVNVLERGVILARGDALTPDLLPEDIRGRVSPTKGAGDDSLEAAERRHIASVLSRCPTLDAAAKTLGIDASTLYRKRERYGLL